MTKEEQIIDAVLEIALEDWKFSTNSNIDYYETEKNGNEILLKPSHGNNVPYLTVNGVSFYADEKIIELKNKLEICIQRKRELQHDKNVSEIFNSLCT